MIRTPRKAANKNPSPLEDKRAWHEIQKEPGYWRTFWRTFGHAIKPQERAAA